MSRNNLEAIESRLSRNPHPASPEAIIAADWQGIGELSHRDTHPIVAQAELVGKPFHRNPPVTAENNDQVFTQEKVVRVVVGHGNGDTVYQSIDETTVTVSDFPHLPIEEAAILYDAAEKGNKTLATVRKQGSSKPFVDINAKIKENGGDPTYKIPKPPQSFATKPLQQAHNRKR